ncbi:OmpH family outer membrane protein [Rhodobacteraceae bacterium]|nr:OmpH family outer membrane protein [Paracoccaceae bacterium]
MQCRAWHMFLGSAALLAGLSLCAPTPLWAQTAQSTGEDLPSQAGPLPKPAVPSLTLENRGAVPAAGPQGTGAIPMPILTLDWEALYQQSKWAKRVKTQIAQESAALAAENDRIAEQLIKEERALTEQRSTMTPQNFRKAADAFDDRATGIREAQKSKAEALSRQLDAEQQNFVAQAVPLLDQLLAKLGAQIVIDRRVIIRGLAQIDVTDEMLDIVDRDLGNGTPQPVPGNLPDPAPDADGSAPPETPADSDGAAAPGGN